MNHILLPFNPQKACHKFVDFHRCCVYRLRSPIKDWSPNSIAVIYRSGTKRLIGEYKIIRIENIPEPVKDKKIFYAKCFKYPVSLYEDGEWYGPTHIFFKDLRIYSPEIPFEELQKFKEKKGEKLSYPQSFTYIDEDDVRFIHSKTSIVTVIQSSSQ